MLQSMSQRVGYDLATEQQQHTGIINRYIARMLVTNEIGKEKLKLDKGIRVMRTGVDYHFK